MQIESIADHLDLVDVIARWHFAEWGQLDPSNTLEAWTEGLRQRALRNQIPTTYVALEGDEPLALSPWSSMTCLPSQTYQRG